MEECNLLVADCVAVCSCCPCLILQFFVFLLLRLPQKLITKAKNYSLKKLRSRRRINGVEVRPKQKQKFEDQGCNDPPKTQLQISNADICSCSEADQVFEEMIQEGMFWFGSFWG
ncbi:hypothetical protein IHE45_17G107500, partial [Dioscorea alata]